MLQQVVPALPLRLVAKRVKVTTFLENPATQTAFLHCGRPYLGGKGPPDLFASCRCHYNVYALDDHLIYLDKPARRR